MRNLHLGSIFKFGDEAKKKSLENKFSQASIIMTAILQATTLSHDYDKDIQENGKKLENNQQQIRDLLGKIENLKKITNSEDDLENYNALAKEYTRLQRRGDEKAMRAIESKMNDLGKKLEETNPIDISQLQEKITRLKNESNQLALENTNFRNLRAEQNDVLKTQTERLNKITNEINSTIDKLDNKTVKGEYAKKFNDKINQFKAEKAGVKEAEEFKLKK